MNTSSFFLRSYVVTEKGLVHKQTALLSLIKKWKIILDYYYCYYRYYDSYYYCYYHYYYYYYYYHYYYFYQYYKSGLLSHI